MASYHWSIKSGKKGSASRHARYIAREGSFGTHGRGEELIAKGSGNLPPWAQGNASSFWRAADQYERSNAAAYREIEMALPVELPAPKQVELVKAYIEKAIGPKTYQFAIHAPVASIGDCAQPHAHIIYSDRLQDEIDREAAQHFRRHNSRCPEKGGCKKDGGGKRRSELRAKVTGEREFFAKLQNKFLADGGHTARVDHRSHADRGIARNPEHHLGQAGVKSLSEQDVNKIRSDRRSEASD